MKKSVISVVVPIYNVEKYLKECLISIQRQSFENWECICIDDGSTDSSYQILDDFAQKDKRFRVYRKKNEGVTSARRLGVEKSEGSFICFVDADDCMLSDALERLYNYQRTYSAEVVRGSFCHWTGSNNSGLTDQRETCEDTKKYSIRRGVDFIPSTLRVCSLWMTLYDIALFKNKERFPDNKVVLGEDGLTLFNVLTDVQRMVMVDDVVYLYRTNEKSCSQQLYTQPEKELQADIDFTEALIAFIEQHDFANIKHLKYYVVDNIYGKFIRTNYFERHKKKLLWIYFRFFCLNINVQLVVFRFNWKKWIKMWLALGKML